MIRALIILLLPLSLAAQEKPNIILFVADDLGNGEIGFSNDYYSVSNGDYYTATPTIDSLARNGAFFANFHSRPVCSPARYGLMTGKHPFRGPGNWDYKVNWPYTSPAAGLTADEETLPEYLKDEGYQTAHFGKWHLGCSLPEHSPKLQGFDYSFGSNFGFASQKEYQIRSVHNFTRNSTKYEPPRPSYEPDIVSDSAIAWMARQAADATTPFFLYYAFTNPHDDAFGGDSIPYDAAIYATAPGGLTASKKQKWASIKNIDNVVADIWQEVRTLAIESNTIIIFTSDNGADATNDPDNRPFNGDKGQSYDGGVRVPLVWYYPGTVDSMTVDSLTCIEDILPTLYEGVCGRTVRNTIDGVNFYPLLSGSGTFPANRVWYGPYIPNRLWSVKRGKWKLANNISASVSGTGNLSNNIQLFDIENDRGEITDVSGSNASVVSELQALIDAITPESIRTVINAPPTGWQDPRWWGDPVFFYNSGYYHTADVPKYKD